MNEGNNDLFDFLRTVQENAMQANEVGTAQTANAQSQAGNTERAMDFMRQVMQDKMEGVQRYKEEVEDNFHGNPAFDDIDEEPSALANSGPISKNNNKVIVRGTFEIEVATDNEESAFDHLDSLFDRVEPVGDILSISFDMSETETVTTKTKSYK